LKSESIVERIELFYEYLRGTNRPNTCNNNNNKDIEKDELN